MLLSQFVPTSPSHTVSTIVFSVCDSTAACKQVNQYHLCRVYIRVLIYNICLSLSDLFHNVQYPWCSPTSLRLTQVHSFLKLSNIPLCICTTISLSIHLLGKKNGAGRINLPDFRIYNKAIVIKIVWYQHKNRDIDHCNKIKSSDINPRTYVFLTK